MGPIWGRQDPGGLHAGPMNLAALLSFLLYVHFIINDNIQMRYTSDTKEWHRFWGLVDENSLVPIDDLQAACYFLVSRLSKVQEMGLYDELTYSSSSEEIGKFALRKSNTKLIIPPAIPMVLIIPTNTQHWVCGDATSQKLWWVP